MSHYFMSQNTHYGFKIMMTLGEKPIEVCRCHSQTIAEKIGAALATTGMDNVQALQLVGRSWRAYRSWGKPAAAHEK
jgi:hypothetical protein